MDAGYVMRRVYMIYFMRQAGQPTVRALVLLALFFAVTPLVSLQHVIINIQKVAGLSGLSDFILSAFTKTELFVQGAAFLALAIVLWTLVDLLKSLGRAPAHA